MAHEEAGDLDWRTPLVAQASWYWEAQLRPRMEGLTDAEYFWEPVPGCWSLRRRADSTAALPAGSGEYVLDLAFPEPDPPPVTTIAWRLAHLTVPVLGKRNADHFDGPAVDLLTTEWPTTAGEALARLDDAYETWIRAIGDLDTAAFGHPVGPAEGPFAADPMVGLVLHVHRELIHHGAEIALLRDLHRHRTEP